MLRPRIIPCLLIRNKGLIKTVKFGSGKYVGDPLNAVRIFNEKKVDELVVLDIDATSEGRQPDYEMIEKLAAECRMPFCYGGGISTVDQAKQIISRGVEKVALSSSVVDRPELIQEIAIELGSQSVVAILDVKKKQFGSRYSVWTHNAQNDSGCCPIALAREFQNLGVGELVINSISNDGVMNGYDIEILKRIREAISVPMTALGGAGDLSHMRRLLEELGVIGVAAGSLFVFKGAYRAVLINYPTVEQRERIYSIQQAQRRGR